MTLASKTTIMTALTAYDKLDTDERDVFKMIIEIGKPTPAAKRGRPPKDKPNATQNS